MDASKLETFTLTITKQGPKGLNVNLQAKVAADVPDLTAHWAKLRGELLADPALAGFAVKDGDEGEEVDLGLSRRTIRANLRFTNA